MDTFFASKILLNTSEMRALRDLNRYVHRIGADEG